MTAAPTIPDDLIVASPQATAPRHDRWWLRRVGRWQAFLLTVLVALVCALADPEAGAGSWQLTLRLAATFWVAILVVNHGAASVRWVFSRRRDRRYDRPRVTSRWILVPVALLLALYARATGIEPALVLGAVVATDYGRETGRARTAVATVAGVVWTVLVAAVAYLGYSFLVAHPVRELVAWDRIDPAREAEVWRWVALGNVVVGELLAVLTVVALTALVVGLLPFALFEGVNVWRASRAVWLVVYALGAAAFLVVVLPVASDGTWTAAARWWALLYVAYVVVGLVTAAVLGRGRGRPERVPEPTHAPVP